MSEVPPDLAAVARYLRSRDVPVLGIVGDTAHTSGYHLGRDRIYTVPPGRGNLDYSIRHDRDRAGLTNAASAVDIGRHPRIIDLGRHLIYAARTDRHEDYAEIIAERSNGTQVWRWTPSGTTGKPASDELYHHLHVAYRRDSRARAKTDDYRAFYEPTEVPDMDRPLYSTGGLQRVFDAGTPVYAEPEGDRISTIGGDGTVYRVVAQTGSDPKGPAGWGLLDGGGEAGRLRWVKLA